MHIITRTLTITALSAGLAAAAPLTALASSSSGPSDHDQRVKIDAKVKVDNIDTRVQVTVPDHIASELRDALRDVTDGIGELVSDVTRNISRDLGRELANLRRDVQIDIDSDWRGGRDRRPNYQSRNWRAQADDRMTKTISIGANGTLELENFTGDITVTASNSKDVTIEFVRESHGKTDADARTGLDRVQPQIDVVGTRATVRATYMDRPNSYSVETNFIVKAPAGTRVVINSLRADVQVTGIKGDLKVTTASGDVVLNDVGAVSEAKTGAGDVTINGASSDGSIEAGTLSGDISLTRVKARRLDANSLNGSIEARDVACENASFTTIVGDILYAGSLAKDGRYEFTSNTGEVRFAPTGNVGYALQVTSFSGEINSSIELTRPTSTRALTGQQRSMRNRAATAKVGDGSATVSLQSFSGDISIGKIK